jgi:hypothetical protein
MRMADDPEIRKWALIIGISQYDKLGGARPHAYH